MNVVVPLGVPDQLELPFESKSAIRSHGKTAIIEVMNDDELPLFIDVTSEGLTTATATAARAEPSGAAA